LGMLDAFEEICGKSIFCGWSFFFLEDNFNPLNGDGTDINSFHIQNIVLFTDKFMTAGYRGTFIGNMK
jgi:hypothetical protein